LNEVAMEYISRIDDQKEELKIHVPRSVRLRIGDEKKLFWSRNPRAVQLWSLSNPATTMPMPVPRWSGWWRRARRGLSWDRATAPPLGLDDTAILRRSRGRDTTTSLLSTSLSTYLRSSARTSYTGAKHYNSCRSLPRLRIAARVCENTRSTQRRRSSIRRRRRSIQWWRRSIRRLRSSISR
jgi:hypothetical protein